MEIYEIKKLSFSYPAAKKEALSDINLKIHEGEFITICGKSGCGKSTLLKQLKPPITPYGEKKGAILFYGVPLNKISQKAQAEKIGFVLQNPDFQIVTDKVWHELSFLLESLGRTSSEIRMKTAEVASFFGINEWFERDTFSLSGGQKQILNLASVMTAEPKVLILDEPTSQLDPIAAAEFFKVLKRLNDELGTTIILSEHRLENVLPLSDRVIVLDKGQVVFDGTPKNAGIWLKNTEHEMFYAMPVPIQAYSIIKNEYECPLTIRDGRLWLEKIIDGKKYPRSVSQTVKEQNKATTIKIKNAWFSYEKETADILRGISLEVKKGDFFAILGGNGTGKSTLLSLISGFLKPYRGKISNSGSVCLVPQNPQTLFSKKIVSEELFEISKDKNKINNVIKLCSLSELMNSNPLDLSGGEQQRLAIAKALLTDADILLFDEPTKGLDAYFKQSFADILKQLTKKGITVLTVSHDIEFCAKYADRCALLFNGILVSESTAREFFSGKSFYTTACSRMSRSFFDDVVTVDDLKNRLSLKEPDSSEIIDKNPKPPDKPPQKSVPKTLFQKSAYKKIISSIILFLIIPITILFGIYALEDRKYYFISFIIIILTFIPFLLAFEERKPKARELLIIAVMCSIAIASRTAFAAVPQFKPAMAIVIISGICLGFEAGFLTGSFTAFVSNFFFGQGPWTCWQMLAFGLVGALSGIIFKSPRLKDKKLLVCAFGGLTTFFIYGGIMNFQTVITSQNKFTINAFFASCVAGFWFDIIHSAATIIFLFFLLKPMLEKLERIKIKYGFMKASEKL